MRPIPGESIWDTELEELAVVIYRGFNVLATDDSWEQEPIAVQSNYLDAALAARAHLLPEGDRS